ncbi:carbamoyltransferase family protein [Candidatus Atelocyanobacterium thalassae]|uniref:Decarbamoylnovobiocin carbamoyltransferase n=1 Tax=cyanobacterium endosymbiont of Braarudosphaera bigelowii TaxID=1285375 RepID=A0ABM7U667_9CHRO|nr:carbamoyltransferase [Candidatus Atelocyanobacterium thalassa]BDA40279.1 decarbamoylnovobiocin carbamoyltransferase [cyanobacterium endosymbiont of Braarudosphaera bigelowii]
MNILGISAYYHDSAAALVKSGNIIAAAQEERFTRKKHDARFPKNAIAYALEEAKLSLRRLDYIVFYEKPLITFERLLETYVAYAPQGFYSFVSAMTVWLKEKLYLKTILKKELAKLDNCKVNQLPPLLFTEHHQSHVASAFFPSPFENAAILCLDAVGEWATTSLWLGKSNQITPRWELQFPHSLGLLYSAFTYYTGFKVNSGEYKLMGLAPYGEPRYFNLILDNLIDIKADGSFRLNMSYFNYATGLKMISNKFSNLFGQPPRKAENKITQHEMDIAASIQKVTEEVILRLANTAYQELKTENLCLAGGVALNCVANGRISREGKFKNIWIQPAAGDAGGAIGAALAVWYQYLGNRRHTGTSDMMQGSYLGPQFDDNEIRKYFDDIKAKYDYFTEDDDLLSEVALILSKGYVVGWFQGRMEFGPRALGNRSILGDPRNRDMQSIMNLKIKYRESFRPFAPSVLTEKASEYFELEESSDYMLLVAKVKEELHISEQEKTKNLFGIDKLKAIRSTIPAVTHVDYSARVQTVNPTNNYRYYNLIKQFEALTGCGVLINTSFNVRGEPIVCTPEDAYRCFMRTEMDYLIINNYILKKVDQNQWKHDKSWQNEFELD